MIKLIKLHPDDNIGVLAQGGLRGDVVEFDERCITLPRDLDMGHKLAIANIKSGENILKYGAPIGTASADISHGEHVHLHNLQSRYTVIEDMEQGQI